MFGKPILDRVKISELSASDILGFALLSKRFSLIFKIFFQQYCYNGKVILNVKNVAFAQAFENH
jgi:hypothetical protein